jgi:UDP-N-acetylglucosamine--N-acetylmuramyl-(pentapeptide) pyrophosphoryl-undecaprenol N-acetylglucosamine transferase
VLVPLPSGRGYQAKNATDLVFAGGGIVIDQDRTEEIIVTALALLEDDTRRNAMAHTAVASRHHGVAQTIADHLMEVGDGE